MIAVRQNTADPLPQRVQFRYGFHDRVVDRLAVALIHPLQDAESVLFFQRQPADARRCLACRVRQIGRDPMDAGDQLRERAIAVGLSYVTRVSGAMSRLRLSDGDHVS